MSNINPQSIDGTYPIAGQDNNSQGFRDNFTNTVNNFTFAAAELTDLQNSAVLKAALGSAGQTGTPINDMNYSYLTHPQIIGAVETKNNIAEPGVGGNFVVDWEQGHFQTVSVATTVGMTFDNWPSSSDVWSRVRLQVTATTLSNITISGTYIENLQNIQGAVGNVLTLNTGIYQFDFSSLDAGAHVWIQDVTRNYDEPLSFNTLTVSGNVLAEGLSIFGNTRVGLVGKISGQYHTVVGNITQTTAGGPVYINTTGNLLVGGNLIIGSVGVSSGAFHTVVGNITQTSSGGAVYINTTGNILATGLNVFGNTRIGSLATPGALHTIIGNVDVSGAGTEYFNIGGNILAVQATFGDLTTNGTTTRAGATVDSGYQFYQPSANVFIQANVTVSRVILAPISSALVSFYANVTLPNTAVDGTVVSISSNSAIQFFSVMAPYPDSGRKLTPQGNVALAAGDKAEYLYRSADNTWYKVG
jgi:hypothetical protein